MRGESRSQGWQRNFSLYSCSVVWWMLGCAGGSLRESERSENLFVSACFRLWVVWETVHYYDSPWPCTSESLRSCCRIVHLPILKRRMAHMEKIPAWIFRVYMSLQSIIIGRTCLVAPMLLLIRMRSVCMQLNTNVIRSFSNVRNFCDTCTTSLTRAQHLWNVLI